MVTEENLVFETVQSDPYSTFECFLCSEFFYILFYCYIGFHGALLHGCISMMGDFTVGKILSILLMKKI